MDEMNNEPTIEFRLSSIEKSIEELKSYIIESKLQQKDIDLIHKTLSDFKDDIKTLDERLDLIEQKPAKRYEDIVGTVISCVMSGLIGFLISLFVKK